MELIFSLIWAVVFAWWCYDIAEGNGRNTTLAIVLGAFFGILAVIGYYIAGQKE